MMSDVTTLCRCKLAARADAELLNDLPEMLSTVAGCPLVTAWSRIGRIPSWSWPDSNR